MFGVTVKGYETAKKSFITMKVDNVDMIEKNLRILDYKGRLSSFGRVEIRVKGVWGSINQKNVNQNTVKTICKSLGYLSGSRSSKSLNQPNQCESYQGNDFCGDSSSLVHFQNLKCEEQDRSLADCYKEIAGS